MKKKKKCKANPLLLRNLTYSLGNSFVVGFFVLRFASFCLELGETGPLILQSQQKSMIYEIFTYPVIFISLELGLMIKIRKRIVSLARVVLTRFPRS